MKNSPSGQPGSRAPRCQNHHEDVNFPRGRPQGRSLFPTPPRWLPPGFSLPRRRRCSRLEARPALLQTAHLCSRYHQASHYLNMTCSIPRGKVVFWKGGTAEKTFEFIAEGEKKGRVCQARWKQANIGEWAGGGSTWINNNVRWLARFAMGWGCELNYQADVSELASAAREQVRQRWQLHRLMKVRPNHRLPVMGPIS